MRIGNHDTDRRVLIVAEIGSNHEGSAELAEALIGEAGAAGADAVKLQTFRAERLVRRADRRRFEQLRRFELPEGALPRLRRAADQAGVLFCSTPFDLESVAALADLVDAYKVASSDVTFGPLLEAVATVGKPMLVSTGLATLEEIAGARATIARVRAERGIAEQLALLHCVSSYPTPLEQANLAAIRTLADRFGDTVGYSDHTLGLDAAVAAVAAGARVVEKHFTIDKHYSEFRDHELSADPPELAELVRRIRAVEAMLGDGVKAPQPCERESVAPLRRVPVARRDLAAGAVLGPDDVVWLRRGDAREPVAERPVGRRLATALAAGDLITPRALRPAAPEPAGAS